MEKRNDTGEFSASPYAHDDREHVDRSGQILPSGSEEVLEEINGVGKLLLGYQSVSEIEELREEEKIDQFDRGQEVQEEDIVCVVIYGGDDGDDATTTTTTSSSTRSKSVSMDALLWTLTNANGAVSSSPSLFLLHVYPPLRFIPTALGKLPISQANEEQRNIHLAKERTRRLQYLQPFLDLCSTSQVSADVIPIEGNKEANSILEVISALQIRRLVLGIHPSSITTPKKQGGSGGRQSGEISGVAGRILEDAPQFCEVNIICQGKQLLFTAAASSSPSPSPSPSSPSPSPSPSSATTTSNGNIFKRIRSINNNPTTHHPQQQQLTQSTHSLGYCKCFKPKTIS